MSGRVNGLKIDVSMENSHFLQMLSAQASKQEIIDFFGSSIVKVGHALKNHEKICKTFLKNTRKNRRK